MAARERYDLLKPKLLKDIVFEYDERIPDGLRYCTETERDGEYEVIRRNGQPPRMVVSSYQIVRQTPAVEFPPAKVDSSRLVFLRQAYRKALRYERGCEKAREASGLNDAARAMYGLYTDVYTYAEAACKLDARSWAGIAIKARAWELTRKWKHNGGVSAGHIADAYVLPNMLALSKGGALCA